MRIANIVMAVAAACMAMAGCGGATQAKTEYPTYEQGADVHWTVAEVRKPDTFGVGAMRVQDVTCALILRNGDRMTMIPGTDGPPTTGPHGMWIDIRQCLVARPDDVVIMATTVKHTSATELETTPKYHNLKGWREVIHDSPSPQQPTP